MCLSVLILSLFGYIGTYLGRASRAALFVASILIALLALFYFFVRNTQANQRLLRWTLVTCIVIADLPLLCGMAQGYLSPAYGIVPFLIELMYGGYVIRIYYTASRP
jgi:hypothetical protein